MAQQGLQCLQGFPQQAPQVVQGYVQQGHMINTQQGYVHLRPPGNFGGDALQPQQADDDSERKEMEAMIGNLEAMLQGLSQPSSLAKFPSHLLSHVALRCRNASGE